MNSHKQKRRMLLVLTAALAPAAGGCESYMKRRDPVSLGAGDAIAANKATQTINRWPRASYEDRWVADGERARIAAHRYRTDTVKDPKALDAEAPQAEPEQASGPMPGKIEK